MNCSYQYLSKQGSIAPIEKRHRCWPSYTHFFFLSCPSRFFDCVLPKGAELLVEQLRHGEADGEKENRNVFLVGAERQRLLSGAEDLGLFKEFNDGSMRAFTCANRDNFKDFKGTEVAVAVAVAVAAVGKRKWDLR